MRKISFLLKKQNTASAQLWIFQGHRANGDKVLIKASTSIGNLKNN